MKHNEFLQINIFGIPSPLHLLKTEGTEYLNAPYEFQLAVVADDPEVLKQLRLGQSVSFSINHAVNNEGNAPQWFNAVIESVCYSAEKDSALLIVVPQLTTLKYKIRSRAYVNQSVLDILKNICREYDIKSNFSDIANHFQPIPYCVQYQESEFHFLSRLCEEDGIYYYFQHSPTSHTLVFSNSIVPNLKYSSILCHRNAQGGDTPYLSSWQRKIMTQIPNMQSRSFNMNSPSQPDTAETQSRQSQSRMPISNNQNIRHDEAGLFPNHNQADIAARLQRQQQSELLSTQIIFSAGNYPNLSAAMQVSVISEIDPQINGEYYLREIHHKATAAIGVSQQSNYENEMSRHAYENQLKLSPQSIAFVPALIHQASQISGVIPALITGSDSQEVYCSDHAAVKVQPEWDHEHGYDEQSSTWIRTTQALAGKGFGSQFVPRVKQTVLLSFQQGWHHKPTVLRSIYNNISPVLIPQSQSGFKTHTLNAEHGEGHVLKFDDSQGQEQVYLKSQKDKEVIVKGHRVRTIKNNLNVQIQNGKAINTIDGNLSIKANHSLHLQVSGSEIILDASGVNVHADFIELMQEKS